MRIAQVVVAPTNSDVLELREVPIPDPQPHDVIVEQVATGVCHSQLHQLGRPRQTPLVLGHESSGVVVATGSAVRSVREGDSVLVSWIPRWRATSMGPPTGLALPDGSRALSPQGVFTWADTTVADERFVVKVAADTPMVEASILGCAVMTGAGAVLNTARVEAGDSVAVIGAGGVGLSALATARITGADPIIAVDVSDEKLDLATTFGATHVINGATSDAVEAVRAITRRPDEATYGGDQVSGVAFAFDCIGIEATMRQALALARSSPFGGEPAGGTAVMVGAGVSAFEVDARDLLVNQKRLVGSLGGSGAPDRDFPRLLDWWKAGLFDVGQLVTDRFKLHEVNAAVEALRQGTVRGRAVLVC